MSARYSKTSSRERPILTLALTGSIASAEYSQTPDAQRVLARVHHFLVTRAIAAQRPAQLAHHPLAIEEHQLTDQRRPVTVDAPVAPFPQRAHALGHEVYFENGSRSRKNGHEPEIRRSEGRPCRCNGRPKLGSRPYRASPMLCPRRGRRTQGGSCFDGPTFRERRADRHPAGVRPGRGSS